MRPDKLKAALELRTADWRDILRGPDVAQARLVLQHLIDLPIKVINQPVPKWMTGVKPEGLMVGIQSVAAPTGTGCLWTVEGAGVIRAA